MKIIEIEDDIYQHLRQQQRTFTESESAVLRRLLNLSPPIQHSGARLNPALEHGALKDWVPAAVETIRQDKRHKPLWDFVTGGRFRTERNAVGRFLALLALLHSENPAKFGDVRGIIGRSRKYFANNEADLKLAGTSVNPKKIPGTDYWVVTNNSSESKVDLLLEVMRVLGYDQAFSAFVAAHLFHSR